ncbi:hypothetical protein GOBAR_AA18127 [Gossypium barbadense]|uniref:Uncharacterized protein n=1 Tax=Gossypium barbadense TaxID=3634 RepID=A0A2P5XGR7_GOSBA|nr:hypothetical protein GOBAR_AA18127 [Gossypium barbadense]
MEKVLDVRKSNISISICCKVLLVSSDLYSIKVVTDLDGNFIVQIGSTGEEGLHDGSFDDATFNRPQDLDYLVEAALIFYDQKKLLDNKPIPLNLEKDNDPRMLTSPLKFPGKLAIDILNNRLFVSDSNHNRIGLAYNAKKNLLYVADTENHALRYATCYDLMLRVKNEIKNGASILMKMECIRV